MAIAAKISLLVLVVAVACRTVSAGDKPLPIIETLPSNCGYVVQVSEGDTCDSLAAFANISSTTYARLNPLALCEILTPAPSSVVCVGDKLATCSHKHKTVAGETCKSIESKLGDIVGGDVNCSGIAPDTQVCTRKDSNKCNGKKLCDVPLTDDMRELLGLAPDYCTLFRECKAPLAATTTEGLPSLTATITDLTKALWEVVGNDGHPELREFAKQRIAGPTQLQIAFIPNARGDGMHASNYVISSGSSGRKLLATAARAGQPGYATYRYY